MAGTPITNKDLQNPVLSTNLNDIPTSFRPTRTIGPIISAVNTPLTAQKATNPQAPPAPNIAQGLTGIQIGYQFAFNQVAPTANQTISSYRVYRNANSNNFLSAQLLRTIVHAPTSSGAIVVQDNVGGSQTYYYFVTAVNSLGLESTGTPAQGGAVTSGLVLSSSVTPVNNSGISTSTSSILSQSGTSKTINVAAFTVQYAKGQVSYNSGSVTPSIYGAFVVFLDDPLFQGGSVIFTAVQQGFISVAADGYCAIGVITTAAGGGGSGGGGGGNPQVCLSPDTRIKTKRGIVRMDEILVGDEVLTACETWQYVLGILETEYEGPVVDLGCGLATPDHHFFVELGKWEKIGSLYKPHGNYQGRVMNLLIKGKDLDEHSYTLENGMIAHNILCA